MPVSATTPWVTQPCATHPWLAPTMPILGGSPCLVLWLQCFRRSVRYSRWLQCNRSPQCSQWEICLLVLALVAEMDLVLVDSFVMLLDSVGKVRSDQIRAQIRSDQIRAQIQIAADRVNSPELVQMQSLLQAFCWMTM